MYVAEEETPYSLALAAATALLHEYAVAPDSIDTLLYCGTPSVAFAPAGSAVDATSHLSSTQRFQYPATRLQYDLDLECASTLALDQLACTSLFSAVRIARALVETGDARRVLCVSSEFFPACAGREAIYNCTADAACAVLVDHDAERNRILASAHTTKGYYWQGDAMRNEIVASYFPTAKHVIAETLQTRGVAARRCHLGDPPQHQRPQLGHPARPHGNSARASLVPEHRADGTHARRRQLHQSARRGVRRKRASRRSSAALLLRLRRALDGAGTGGMTMSAERSILITGATGLLGRDVLARLLAADSRLRAYVLVRDLGRWLRTARELGSQSRVIPVHGDLCADGLGLTPDARAAIRRDVTAIVHLAADTTFSSPLDRARAVNTLGTQRVLEIADDCDARRARGLRQHGIRGWSAHRRDRRRSPCGERWAG